jgi:hypothetical protein
MGGVVEEVYQLITVSHLVHCSASSGSHDSDRTLEQSIMDSAILRLNIWHSILIYDEKSDRRFVAMQMLLPSWLLLSPRFAPERD